MTLFLKSQLESVVGTFTQQTSQTQNFHGLFGKESTSIVEHTDMYRSVFLSDSFRKSFVRFASPSKSRVVKYSSFSPFVKSMMSQAKKKANKGGNSSIDQLLVCPASFARFAALECTATMAHLRQSSSNSLVDPTLVPTALPMNALMGFKSTELNETVYGHHSVAVFAALNGGKTGAELQPDNLRVDEWLRFLSSNLEPLIIQVLKCPNKANSTEIQQQVSDSLRRIDEAISANKQGSGKAIVGGGLSLADIAIVSQLHTIQELKLEDLSKYRSLQGFVEHVVQLDGFQSGLAEVRRIEEMVEKSPANIDPSNILRKDDYTISLQESLRNLFTLAVHDAFPNARESGVQEAELELNANTKMKHNYQCNSALGIFGRLKNVEGALPSDCKNPRSVAEKIIEHAKKLDSDSGVIHQLELSGPGFINIYISPSYLAERVAFTAAKGLQPPPTKPCKVGIDYSSPNIAKEMHVGHLRSTIIGDAMSRILEYLGHEVKRYNHVGDWGTQFGMLISHMKDRYPDADKNPPNISDLSKFYKEAKERFDKEDGFKTRSQQEVVKLQSGDVKNVEMWRALCRISESMFSQVYRRLGIHNGLKVYGESFYNSQLPSVVEEMEKKGLTTISDGAKTIFVENAEVPLMLQKRDGGYGYDSTDLAALRYRLYNENCNWLIYVVDSGQALHFDLVFKAAEKAGWIDAKVHRVEHTGFGVVQGQDRKKFKSRSGDTVRLVDLLDEARDRMLRQLTERVGQGNSQLPRENLEHAAECLGYGGVKYFDLRQNRQSDYVFDYDRMLSADGDTAVYMQYAHARMQSILRKLRDSGHDVDSLIAQGTSKPTEYIDLSHHSEHTLAEELCKWADICKQFEKNLLPNVFTNFIYELAGKFSDFYRDCKLLGSDEKTLTGRLVLVKATAETIATVLRLLGIEPLDRL